MARYIVRVPGGASAGFGRVLAGLSRFSPGTTLPLLVSIQNTIITLILSVILFCEFRAIAAMIG